LFCFVKAARSARALNAAMRGALEILAMVEESTLKVQYVAALSELVD
jgi:hypothetical protein